MMIFCLPVIFIFFSLFKPVFFSSNWGKLDVPDTFHVNFCSFLIGIPWTWIHCLGISTPQQLPARGPPCLQLLEFSCDLSCSFVIGQFQWTSSRTHLLGWNFWQKPKYKFCVINVSILLRWDVKRFNFCQPTLLDQQFDPSLSKIC